MLLRLFQRQIAFQCRAVLIAAQLLDQGLAAVRTSDPATRQDAMDVVWVAIQDLLGAAANIGKALWGQAGSLASERVDLRASLGVDDASPLRNVTMRNNFEHFDERLDRWWKQSSSHNYADMNVMGPGAVVGIAEGDVFRTLDPTTGDVVFWGQRFSLPEIITEVHRLLPLATIEADRRD